MSEGAKSIAVCPGSYDPVTNGHLDVIRAQPASTTRSWSPSSTARCARAARCSASRSASASSNARSPASTNVRVEPFSTLVVDFARSLGARKAIVKGLRAISDFEYELEMNQLNRRQDPTIESVYLMASPQYSFLSSSGVKELATFGGRIDDLVPDDVARRLQEELRR